MDKLNEYFSTFPEQTQLRIEEMRSAIKAASPHAEEKFASKMPTYEVKGKRVAYFAAYSKYIALYAMGVGQEEFAEELSKYEVSKGTVKFPLTEPIPAELVKKIVKLKVKEAGLG